MKLCHIRISFDRKQKASYNELTDEMEKTTWVTKYLQKNVSRREWFNQGGTEALMLHTALFNGKRPWGAPCWKEDLMTQEGRGEVPELPAQSPGLAGIELAQILKKFRVFFNFIFFYFVSLRRLWLGQSFVTTLPLGVTISMLPMRHHIHSRAYSCCIRT